jgi:hypothetical protein
MTLEWNERCLRSLSLSHPTGAKQESIYATVSSDVLCQATS